MSPGAPAEPASEEPRRLKIGLVAGEASGDRLGAGLMHALAAGAPAGVACEFLGIGGEQMLAAGLHSVAPMDLLNVNGFRDPILKLPSLWRLLKQLTDAMVAADVDVFVGVDFNVFNFLLEGRLKRRGLRTAHYVSPSVYAWRRGRTRRVARTTDLLLCLYPFEPAFYAATATRAEFVGHPLADEIAPDAGSAQAQQQARAELGLPAEGPVLAVLPGSRASEVRLMMPSFAGAATAFAHAHDARIVIPCLRPALRAEIEQVLAAGPALPVTLYDGDARRALTACDVALVKSGTSTLEAMLLHRPMVVSYRLGAVSYQLARRLVRTQHIALPNILAGETWVPEFWQDAATPAALAQALTAEWRAVQDDPTRLQRFEAMHETLRRDADATAARAVLGLLTASR